MNKSDISKEKIIEQTVLWLKDSGNSDINMRDVAKLCGASVGSIYNYFPTKADLVIAVVENVWKNAFHPKVCMAPMGKRFTDIIAETYTQAYNAQSQYHNFFIMHRTMIDAGGKAQGKSTMNAYIEHIKMAFMMSLKADKLIDNSVWTEELSPEKLIGFIFSSMMSSLTKGEPSCSFLIVVLKKLLYV